MQCPNCKKEAINVNGKFVCLDCGVELNPKEDASTQPPIVVNPSITNHEDSVDNTQTASQPDSIPSTSPVVSQPEPTVPNENQPIPTPPVELSAIPIEPVASIQIQPDPIPPTSPAVSQPEPSATIEPVKEDFLNDINKPNTDGSYDFNQTVPGSTQAPEPTLPETPVAPQTSEPAQPENFFQPEYVDITPGKVEEKKAKPAENRESETFDAYSTPSGIGVGEPLVEDLESQKDVSEFGISDNPTLDKSRTIEAEELFTQDNIPKETPQEPTPVNTASPVIPEPEQEAPQNTDASLDDLLEKYSDAPASVKPAGPAPAFDSVQPIIPNLNEGDVPFPQTSPNPYQPNTTNVAQEPGQIPGGANIPPADSVFGPQPEGTPENLNIPSTVPKSKKKIVIISIVAILAVMVIGVLVYFGLFYNKPKDTKTNEEAQQGETFQISEEVSGVMDLPQNMEADFEQLIDFSGVTVLSPEGQDPETKKNLDAFVKKPVSSKGTWKVDNIGNIKINGIFAEKVVEKTYIETDKTTYVLNPTSNVWTKTDGDNIKEVPVFYAPKVKAALFYNTKVDSIDEVDDEIIEGTTYRKIKIVPKADIIESALSETSPLLAGTNYNSLNLESLEVLAWITGDGLIYKIKISGDVVVDSDLYNGTVMLTSSATYTYSEVDIRKPEQTASITEKDVVWAILNKKTIG